MPLKNHRTALTIFGLLLTLGVPALPISQWENEFASVSHLVGYEIIWWALVALVLLYVHLGEVRPLASIGFHAPGVRGVFIGIAAGPIIIAGLAGIYFVVLPALHLSETQQMNQLLATPFWWRFISVIRAAVAEEILFRGYAIERMKELIGSRNIAAVVSCTIFALEHVGPWGWGHLLIAGFGGAVLTALYLWRRNLWVNMIAHFIVDTAGVLLS